MTVAKYRVIYIEDLTERYTYIQYTLKTASNTCIARLAQNILFAHRNTACSNIFIVKILLNFSLFAIFSII